MLTTYRRVRIIEQVFTELSIIQINRSISWKLIFVDTKFLVVARPLFCSILYNIISVKIFCNQMLPWPFFNLRELWSVSLMIFVLFNIAFLSRFYCKIHNIFRWFFIISIRVANLDTIPCRIILMLLYVIGKIIKKILGKRSFRH